MADIGSIISKAYDDISQVKHTVSDVSNTVSLGSRTLKAGGSALNTLSGGALKEMTASQTPNQNVSARASANGTLPTNGKENLIAPEGTCIIIPAVVSMTGQPRYIGAEAYQTIVDMINGKPTLGNAVVVGDDGKPSSKVYDVRSDGVFLKGTQTKVDIKIDEGKGTVAGVLLNEREFESCVKGITSTDQNEPKFTTSSELGQAEDANLKSWWRRNLEWLIIGLGTVLGGAAIFLLIRHQKNKTKKTTNTANTLKSQADTLTNQINDLQKQKNTLANNAQSVPENLADFVQITQNQREVSL